MKHNNDTNIMFISDCIFYLMFRDRSYIVITVVVYYKHTES